MAYVHLVNNIDGKVFNFRDINYLGLYSLNSEKGIEAICCAKLSDSSNTLIADLAPVIIGNNKFYISSTIEVIFKSNFKLVKEVDIIELTKEHLDNIKVLLANNTVGRCKMELAHIDDLLLYRDIIRENIENEDTTDLEKVFKRYEAQRRMFNIKYQVATRILKMNDEVKLKRLEFL